MSRCSVKGCGEPAVAEVILYDVYEHGEVFFERDYTCPFICMGHLLENEEKIEGERRPRGYVECPYTNLEGAQGFTIYRPLE